MGCCHSDEAPFLTEYFAKQEKLQNEAMVGDNPFEMIGKIGEIKKKQEKMKKDLVDVIENAFAHHDSDEDGVLDPEEADEFFEHFVERFVEFQCKTGLKALDKQTAMQGGMMGVLGMGDDPMMKMMQKAMEKTVEDGKKKLRQQRKDRLQNYRDNAHRLDAAAFAVLDTNNNGKLDVDEVVKALTPDTDEYMNLLVALELLSEAEVQMAKMGKEMAGDCPQQ
mmetsp:Transcript_135276/g.269890  ORF Transcript_135276/g.269890 Transcript_135276/m.269890 type:complete len:222 (-) Transcript_135276:1464-2129(-)|eukprot:CAMPEP_0172668372 /NCGR_PEP_ID=MMETSP1074-20121228/9019_1 /TAXON_ID=2916 /ORGANISM="Ceratium fusus, Strain PA161109" /LENGTH=221 /DNA_ID=CAMNT_0013485013 /DNA_START=60 /DNA_END=725 /DNA_ORIENTATION=+